MNNYKLRAETVIDVTGWLNTGPDFEKITIASQYIEKNKIPDVDIEIETGMSLEDLRASLSQVENGHVMVESVNYFDGYTGERYYT